MFCLVHNLHAYKCPLLIARIMNCFILTFKKKNLLFIKLDNVGEATLRITSQ